MKSNRIRKGKSLGAPPPGIRLVRDDSSTSGFSAGHFPRIDDDDDGHSVASDTIHTTRSVSDMIHGAHGPSHLGEELGSKGASCRLVLLCWCVALHLSCASAVALSW